MQSYSLQHTRTAPSATCHQWKSHTQLQPVMKTPRHVPISSRAQASQAPRCSASDSPLQQLYPSFREGTFSIEMEVRDTELDQFGVVNQAQYPALMQHGEWSTFKQDRRVIRIAECFTSNLLRMTWNYRSIFSKSLLWRSTSLNHTSR